MFKRRNPEYMNFAKTNRKSVGAGYTTIPSIIQLVQEKKSAAGNDYFFVIATTLNKTPVFVAYEEVVEKKDKRARTDEPPRAAPVYDIEDGVSVLQDGKYGVIVKPYTVVKGSAFDKPGITATGQPGHCKLTLVASLYNGVASFKIGQVVADPNPQVFDGAFYAKHVAGTELAVIPTRDNITAEMFGDDVDPKYWKRDCIIPLSNDCPAFAEVEPLIEPEDSKRFEGTVKNDSTIYPSVNVDVGSGQTSNSMSVVYKLKDETKYFFKFAYRPKVWRVFGVTDVNAWSKVAGRLILNSRDWYAVVSSKLDDIMRLASNAGSDEEPTGYGGYDFGENGDGSEEPLQDTQTTGMGADMIATTGFVSAMSIDMSATARNAGVELTPEFVLEHFGPASSFKSKSTRDTENPLNASWRMRMERRENTVYNFTELDDYIRVPFMEEAKKLDGRLKYYGVFAVGDDRPYEHAGEEGYEAMLKTSRLTPAVVYAVVSK